MDRICAIVVTYNRLSDLKKCIVALKEQTLKCDIIIINNGSTDGTKEYLATINGVNVINQNNLGGAGGFYSGTKYAYEHGYEWIWMMDDDGLPDKDQLQQLLFTASSHGFKILNALVIDKEDHSHLAFGKHEPIATINIQNEYIKQPLSPFNGTFIHRSVIDKVGFIKKEMFIWGDEQEYMARIRQGGFTPYTVTKAIHYHPREKGQKDWALPFIKKGQVMIKPPKMSHYYYRNLGYINWRYSGKIVTIKNIIYYTIFFLRKLNIEELIKFYKYFIRGIKNKYN